MAIRWEDIQNLSVTESEINLLAGLTATASEINDIAGFTGTSSDLNNLIGLDLALAAHEAEGFATAHPILANSLDGLLLADATVTKAKLSFNAALDTDIAGLQVQVDSAVSDTAVQQTQIDNLFGIVIPGQGSSISDAINQTIAHIEKTIDAHDSSSISYGNYYQLTGDITGAVTTTLILPSSIIKFFRAGELIRFQDDITPAEDVILTTVNYTTNEITFPTTTSSFTIADNGIIWTLAEDQVQEGLNRSFRNDGETKMLLREGVFTGTMDTQILTADRTWTLRDEDFILGNPSLVGNSLSVLRTNFGETDVEWHDLTAADINFTNLISGLTAVDVQAAIDELDNIVDLHIADLSIHFTEASITHLNIQDIGTNTHVQIDNHIADLTLHRIINDAGTSLVEMWSANKINAELASKSDTTHNHDLDLLSNVNSTGKVTASILEWDGTSSWIPGVKGEINTASNLVGGQGVFGAKVGSDLQFKSLVAGSNISLSSDANGITISTSGGLGEVNTASNVGGANGIFKQKTLADLEFLSLAAGTNVTITPSGDTLVIASTSGGGGGGGTAITRTQTAHGFSLLEGIYHDGTIWQKAQANNAETLAEYVITEVTDSNNFIANKFGEATIAAHGKIIGQHYFLSDSIAGGAQTIEPSTFSNPLFYVEDANTIHVEVYRPSDVTTLVSDTAKWQRKDLVLNQTAIATVSDLTFNNLTIGKTYRISGQLRVQGNSGAINDKFMNIQIHNGITLITESFARSGNTANYSHTDHLSVIFTATDAILTTSISSNSNCYLANVTFKILEELPVHTETTIWI